MTDSTTTIAEADLDAAYDGSWYFIAGTGYPLEEWVSGYESLLADVGKPVAWYRTTGAAVNAYAERGGRNTNPYDPDLTCLLFPLDGLNIPLLAVVKIGMCDRWFDDVIQNMRAGEEE